MSEYNTFLTAAQDYAKEIAKNQNKYLSKYTGAKKIDAKDIKIQFDKTSQKAYIDFDGDGQSDYSFSQADAKVENPIVRDLREQKRVLLGVETPQAKRLIAQIDKEIKALGGNTDVSHMEEETLPPETPVEKQQTTPVSKETPEEQQAPAPKQPKTEEKETPDNKYIGTELNVTNPSNPNGAIKGTITDVQFNDKNIPTSITIESKTSGNKFTYTYDEKSGKYLNKKENKYYKLDENNNLVRDNEYEAKNVKRHKAAVQEATIFGKAPAPEKLAKMKELGITSAGVKDYFEKTNADGNKVYYQYDESTGNFKEKPDIMLVTPPSVNGQNYVIRTKGENGGYTENYYSTVNGQIYQSVNKDNEGNTLGITKFDGLKTTKFDKNNNLTYEKIVDNNGNTLYEKDYTAKPDPKSLSFKSLKPVNNGSGFAYRNMNYETFKNDFNKQIWSVSYLNGIVNNYGIDAAKQLIDAYNTEAKENGTKTIGQQLNSFMLGLNGELKAYLRSK